MKRILVTGGTGFVGANLVRRALSDGHRVDLLVRPAYADWRIAEIRSDIGLHEVDLNDSTAVQTLLRAIRPDWIFHLAAYGAYSPQTELDRMIQTNLVSTINLVNACLDVGFEAFVNSGSSSEYGFKDHPPSETEWLEPNSPYAVTKASASLYCRYIAQSRGVRLPTLRLYSVYGPYEEPTRLIPTVIVKGLRGQLPELVAPDVARDFVYVSDVCEAYLRAASTEGQAPGAIYNVGTGRQTTIKEVVDLAQKHFGITQAPVWSSMKARVWDTASWVADPRAAREALGWTARTPFAEGFKNFATWMEGHPHWKRWYRLATGGAAE